MQDKQSQQLRAHFFIGTQEYNTKECAPLDADGTDHAILDGFINQLCNQNTDHIFITYNLLPSLQKAYGEAHGFFAKKNIHKPLKQIIIEPGYPILYRAGGKQTATQSDSKRVIFYDFPQKNTQQIRKKKWGIGLSEHFKCIVALQLCNWRWYDTHHGLYYLTQKPSTALHCNKFRDLGKDPLKLSLQQDTNRWVDHLGDIINTSEQDHLFSWAIYIDGHGTQKYPKKFCLTAGLSEKHIATLFNFFNNNLTIDVVGIQSCYTTAQRIHALTQKYFTSKENFKFPLIGRTFDGTKEVGHFAPDGIHCYYPLWYQIDSDKNEGFTPEASFLLPNLLARIQKIKQETQGNSEEYNEKVYEFLTEFPFYPNLSLLPANHNQHREARAREDAHFPPIENQNNKNV